MYMFTTICIIITLGIIIYLMVKTSIQNKKGMIVTEINGDLLKLFNQNVFTAIAHGCNCQNMMGAGIAKQIKDKYPQVYDADTQATKYDFNTLGNYSRILIPTKGYIFNLYTQIYPGSNANSSAIYNSLSEMIYYFKIKGVQGRIKIGVPLIGCGIGGLDKEDLLENINLLKDNNRFANIDLVIVNYKPSKR